MKRTNMLAIVIVAVVIIGVGTFVYLNYASGALQILMTDPPSNWGSATQIYIKYSAIEVHRADAGNESGWFTVIDTSGWINLTRTLEVNQTIGSKNLQAGVYNLIRFSILEAFVTVANVNHTATVPSGKLQIAITQGGIRINAGQTASLLIDLNVKVEGSIESGFTIVPDVRATPI
nr:DUF4382 domain-containing protein [Candidatus Njordarchaeota archaeon]